MDFKIFLPVPVTGQQIVQAGRRYLGCKYTVGSSKVWFNEDGSIREAKFNCLGFLFQVAKDVSLLPPDFPIDIRRFDKSLNWEDTVNKILEANLVEVPLEESTPGDILRMRYADIDPNAPIHVAIKTTIEGVPQGKMLHAVNFDVGGNYPGKVVENRLDINEWSRILSAHRIIGKTD